MKIFEALKNPDETVRLDNGDKWLVWNDNSSEWEVYRHKPYAKKAERVAHTVNEDEAVAVLLSRSG